MRSRSNSGIRLDYFQRLVNRSILKYQSPATGLISSNDTNHAWVRDNIYCVMAVWGLALAYRKTQDLDEDRAKAYELEKAVVSAMRGLLRSMQMQTEKVEQFKRTQSPRDALHAKYSSITGKTAVEDYEWGHLQIDATSLFLLVLAQMTASGVIIIFTLDEVAFVQNLVFYIETAYRCPDYGIWERGDKTNHGLPELNASSIGMAKAALEAINELDLFGSRGGPASVIHVLPDEAQQCQAILTSMLPRESISKETDAALLTVVSFPAFAVDDPELIALTNKTIKEKLEGPYGCSRFLRDGYKTAEEDPHRLHYEPWELMVFEKIECQWPLFFAFFILDGHFTNNQEQVNKYTRKLEEVLLKTEDGISILPELYSVPKESVALEYQNPNSQKRVPAGKIPHMWGQSMYILGSLMTEGFLSPGELDPLNRRHVTETKPDVVVQVVLLAEDSLIQDKLAMHGIELQTVAEVAPIQIHPARVLSKIYSLLGKNKRIGLSGRASSSEIGLLATSKLYTLRDKILAFVPQLADRHQFYLGLDVEYMVDNIKTKLDFLSRSWTNLGRPLVVLNLQRASLDNYQQPPNALLATIKKLQSGYISGTRVHLGKLTDFLNTSCITKLSFLKDIEDHGGRKDKITIDQLISQTSESRPRLLSDVRRMGKSRPSMRNTSLSVIGIVRRSRSIQIEPEDVPDLSQLERRRKSSVCPDALAGIVPKPEISILVDEYNGGASHKALDSSCPGSSGYSRQSSYTTTRSNSPESPTSIQINIEAASSSLKAHHLKDEVDMSASPGVSPSTSPKPLRRHVKHVVENDETDSTELVEQLKNTSNLQEQADIIHYLFVNNGPDWDTHMEEDRKVTVKELLTELYEKAGTWKQWWLVRHTAGMLRKRVEDLALAATDLLVRQKQLSVGLPPDHETIITCPLPPDELAAIIYEACGEDHSTASLTQELLVYLAMFIRTEPNLFDEMLRLRVGLIIQVMASELSRTLQCSGDEASDHLLNLSPFEMKTLLHHILSGKEFVISCEHSHPSKSSASSTTRKLGDTIMDMNRRRSVVTHDLPMLTPQIGKEHEDHVGDIDDRQGQWLRRRRLDGSLNRVPLGFYPLLWELLRRCHGLMIKGNHLPGTLTREMTKGEFKFALQVEMVLNRIPQPEYRQLMVEAMMILSMLVENDGNRISMSHLDIEVDKIVHEANNLFIRDMKMSQDIIDQSNGAAGVCLYLYDSAPSGRFGSMSYICRALTGILHLPINADNAVECSVS